MQLLKADSGDEAGKSFNRWIAGLAALAVVCSVGLLTNDMRQGKQRAKKVLQTDANWQRKAAKILAEAPFWQSVEDVDDLLAKPDGGSDQHG